MKIDQKRLRELLARELPLPAPDQLWREENVFFVGGNLPERETIETLFDSHFQSNASLFHLTFGTDSFPNGETLARGIKKNFHAHLMGRFDFLPQVSQIERAYAAGIDILDIPLARFRTVSGTDDPDLLGRLAALESARSVFPRWSVASTLLAGEETLDATLAGIDALLALGVVPLVRLSVRSAERPTDELSRVFAHLFEGWRRNKVSVKPLLPMIHLVTPLVRKTAPGVLRGFIDLIDDRRLVATSDLRRLLRVKEVEQSYASSGL